MKPIIVYFVCLTHLVIGQPMEKDLLSIGEHYVTIDGVQLWYKVCGHGPILLVYAPGGGWGDDASYCIEKLKHLEKIRKTIYFEPRGIDHSQRIDEGNAYHLENYVNELATFVDLLNISSFDLISYCYGTVVTLQYAIDFPDKLNHFVLINSGIASAEDELRKRLTHAPLITKNDITRTARIDDNIYYMESMDGWAEKSYHNYNPIAYRFSLSLEKVRHSMAFNLLQNDYYQNCNRIATALNEIKAKTLIITGEEDNPCHKISSFEINENVRLSELIVIHNEKQWPFIEQPEQFFESVNNFLSY